MDFISFRMVKELWKRLNNLRGKREIEKEGLQNIFGDLNRLAKCYIEPRCQTINPSEVNEEDTISIPKQPIFEFLNTYFNGHFQHYDGRNQLMVLSDAGMGKTSLLLMLKLIHLNSFWPKNYKCKLFKLGKPTLDEVRKLPDKTNTILLLDALDEDSESFGRVKERLKNILLETKYFKRVVITCRTQFFPQGEKDHFDRIGNLKINGYTCPTIYLSFFNDDQVLQYLIKLFPDRPDIITAAQAIVQKMGSLRFRPLLLSHIEDFIDSNKTDWNEFEIFRALIGSWLSREQRKLSNVVKDLTDQDLLKACERIAYYLQARRKRTLSVGEIRNLKETCPHISHIKNFDIGGRSLLNKNSLGDFRFSHYIIQEFLIVNSIVKNTVHDEDDVNVTDQIVQFLNLVGSHNRNYREISFKFANLSGMNLSGIFAESVDFSSAYLENANLTSAQLSKACFNDAKLVNTKLINTVMSKASLKNAVLRGSDFWGAKMIGANLVNTKLHNAKLENTDLTDANLSNAILSNAEINNTVFTNCKLRGANFSDALIKEVEFDGADIREINMQGCNLEGYNFQDANIENSFFRNSKLNNANFHGANLYHANLTEASINNANLNEANLIGANLSGAFLNNTNLSKTNLMDADLSGASLNNANLTGANLIGANLTNTNLKGAILDKANLLIKEYDNSIFTDTRMKNTVVNMDFKPRISGKNIKLIQVEDIIIVYVEYTKDYIIKLTFNNEVVFSINLKDIIQGDTAQKNKKNPYKQLRNLDIFKRGFIDKKGKKLIWEGEITISSKLLYQIGLRQL